MRGGIGEPAPRGFLLFLLVMILLVSSPPLWAQYPFVGQIKIFAGNYAPQGWAFCDGQLLPISQYDVLYSLIGTTYGGDGQTTFALPDLRGRAVVGVGQGGGLSSYSLGQTGGSETVTLTTGQIPAHTHGVGVQNAPGSSDTPVNAVPAVSPDGIAAFNPSSSVVMNPAAVGSIGGGQPHNNVKPHLAVRYIIALEGIYPARP